MDLSRIALRVVFAYAFLLVIMRIAGKRTIAHGTPLDFVVALIIGDMIDNLFWGDVAASVFVAGCGVVLTLHILLSMAAASSKQAYDLINGRPRLVLSQGSLLKAGRAAERLSEDDVLADMRGQGVTDLRELDEVTIEPSGAVGVIKHKWSREAQKSDSPRLPERRP